MSPIHAIYENGVFRPLTPVDLPENCTVTLMLTVVNNVSAIGDEGDEELNRMLMTSTETGIPDLAARHDEDWHANGLRELYRIIGQRHSSGYTDTAERHNELEP